MGYFPDPRVEIEKSVFVQIEGIVRCELFFENFVFLKFNTRRESYEDE